MTVSYVQVLCNTDCSRTVKSMSRISLKLDILHKQVTQSLVTYPEQKVEEKEDALRAFQPAADDHCCHEKVAASLRLQTSTSPALKKN